jgi:hypothetical protein
MDEAPAETAAFKADGLTLAQQAKLAAAIDKA